MFLPFSSDSLFVPFRFGNRKGVVEWSGKVFNGKKLSVVNVVATESNDSHGGAAHFNHGQPASRSNISL